LKGKRLRRLKKRERGGEDLNISLFLFPAKRGEPGGGGGGGEGGKGGKRKGGAAWPRIIISFPYPVFTLEK